MAKLVYGTIKFINFSNMSDVYETIGILTASNYTKLKIEQNQLSGAWGREGRILIYSNAHKFLVPVTTRFSAGKGLIQHRVNCNDFILDLIANHGFTTRPVTSTGKTADVIPPSYDVALSLVPITYHADFIRGYIK